MIPAPGIATRGQRTLHFQSIGDGRALVLIPGLGGGSRLFGTLPRRFARTGRRALTYDPVGVTPSDPLEGPFRFEDAADDLFAVADAAGIDTLDLVGTSLGGKVALVAAARHPDRVRRVVLLASAAVVHERAKRVYRFFETVAGGLPAERFADAVVPFLFGRTFVEERPAIVDDIARATRPDDARRALMVAQAQALQSFDGVPYARTVLAPTLCLAGAEDTLTDVADVEQTAKVLPRGTFRAFERAGHSLLLEDAGVFDAVMGFLDA
jgi:3-oxoadipate enol-lactonase